MKSCFAAITAVICLVSAELNAAEVTFRGTINSYTQFLGVADPLGISQGLRYLCRLVKYRRRYGDQWGISFQTIPNRNFLFSGGAWQPVLERLPSATWFLAGVPGVTLTFSLLNRSRISFPRTHESIAVRFRWYDYYRKWWREYWFLHGLGAVRTGTVIGTRIAQSCERWWPLGLASPTPDGCCIGVVLNED